MFCGAGISRDSGLPVVNEFVPYILLRLSTSDEDFEKIIIELEEIDNTKEKFEKLLRILSEKMTVSEEVILNILDNMPL